MVASILKIIIARNTICDNLVGFPKSGHIYSFQPCTTWLLTGKIQQVVKISLYMVCFELSFATTAAINEQIDLHRLACFSAAVICFIV